MLLAIHNDSTQEPYMEVVNPFILKNKERMVVFLDQLSSVQEPGNPPQNSNNVDIGKYYYYFNVGTVDGRVEYRDEECASAVCVVSFS